jgi:hypothetical protein
MAHKRWILPALLALPFLAVAVIDVSRWASFRSLDDVDLLKEHGDSVSFLSSERVVDMRTGPGRDQIPMTKELNLDSGWGESTTKGTWTANHRATMTWDLDVAGQSVLWIECRVDRRKGPPPRLMTFVNGAPCGGAVLSEKTVSHRVNLAVGQVTSGLNEIELRLVSAPPDVPATGRTLLVRRLALTDETAAAIPDPSSRQPVIIKPDSVLIQSPGRFVLPFRLSVGGSELGFRYRFRDPKPGREATVTVGRRYAGPDRFRVIREKTLTDKSKRAGRFRQILDDRFEPNVLIVDVNAVAAEGGFELRELTLHAYHEPANRRSSQTEN